MFDCEFTLKQHNQTKVFRELFENSLYIKISLSERGIFTRLLQEIGIATSQRIRGCHA